MSITDEQNQRIWYIHQEVIFRIKNEIISSSRKWIELDAVNSNEVKPSPKDRYHMISLICGNWKGKDELKTTEGWLGKGRDLEEGGKEERIMERG